MATIDTDVDFSESRATEINVLGWVFTGTATATVFLKLLARGHVAKDLGWDDFFILFSLTLSVIAAGIVSHSVFLGLGRHTAAVIAEHGMEGFEMASKWHVLAFPFNIASFSFPNIAIAILVSRLLDPNPLRTRCLYAMVALQVVFAMVSIILLFLQCKPTQMLWKPSIEGKCWDESVFNAYLYWVSAYTTVTDIVLAVVPISAFWNLQMRASTKWAVCVMMGLTFLSALVTIVKATYIHLFSNRTDPLYKIVPLVLWGLVEQNVVIVAACIPTLRPLFRKAFESRNSRSGTNSRPRLGFTFTLPSTPGPERLHSEPESTIPLGSRKTGFDAKSDNSQHGILRTVDVDVDSDEGNDLEGNVDGTYIQHPSAAGR
ncbi:hypothetical protein BO70DRAFT_360754 [Aspergillus heteromorphus CBS 117.55]|uniref:Rhodopsin domain-containing protein n=1 Tax=Aspergillus heteromorphus CBS 117.55 TaxID=1448321 RepID=A0A317WHN8_9EURO|nr:uncharacterized protein BO70DRAFT_360754 [Aspergillus heteromorphus CBS 117.55]PWY85893.1 hypothetical protein BO70DRAFT_360754 [Aspergillus heteromorphus CBS 117.55]